MGGVLMVGTLAGSTAGVWLFALLRKFGQIDLVIILMYIVFLGGIAALMISEIVRAIMRERRSPGQRLKLHQHT